MLFSQRKGFKEINKIIQKDTMNDELRNSLWNVLELMIWNRNRFMHNEYGIPIIDKYSTELWFSYFKKPIDTRKERSWDILNDIREYYFRSKWFEVFDFLEFTLEYFNEEPLVRSVNFVLERELSAFRFVGGVFTDITSQEEIKMLEEALSDKDYPGVTRHLKRSLELLSDRIKPDFRNSIKESISAVESIAQVISNKPKATLGDALKVLEKSGKIHQALKDGFSKLYGYTSDEGGIRHSMIDEPNINIEDAKYFLLSCTSFINYLKSKI